MADLKVSSAEQSLKRVGKFSNDGEMNRVLNQVEGNVQEATRAIAKGKTDAFQATPLQTKNGIAKFSDVWVYDPAGGSLTTIQLPKVSQVDHGKWIILKRKSNSIANVAVKAAAGQLIELDLQPYNVNTSFAVT